MKYISKPQYLMLLSLTGLVLMERERERDREQPVEERTHRQCEEEWTKLNTKYHSDEYTEIPHLCIHDLLTKTKQNKIKTNNTGLRSCL